MSRVVLLRLAASAVAFSSVAANLPAAAKSQRERGMQKVLADKLNGGPSIKTNVEYHSMKDKYDSMRYNSGWKKKQAYLIKGLKESKNRLESDPEMLKKMLMGLINEANRDTLVSTDGFELQVELDPLIEYVCKEELDITDVQVLDDFKAMMGAELQNYTQNYASSYLPEDIKKLSEILIATLEKK